MGQFLCPFAVNSRITAVVTMLFPQLSCFFLSCTANAMVKLAKTGHGPHSPTLVVICAVRLLFVLFCVLFVCKCVLPPGDNQIAVNKYIPYINSSHKLFPLIITILGITPRNSHLVRRYMVY